MAAEYGSDLDLADWLAEVVVVHAEREAAESALTPEQRARAEKQERQAEAQRRIWRRQGVMTRRAYNRLPKAVSRAHQDEVARLRAEGATRGQILAEMRAAGAEISEYAVKLLLRVIKFDPEAFELDETGDVHIVRR